MQGPEAAWAALTHVAFRVTWSIQTTAPGEQFSFQFGRFRGGTAARTGPGCGETKRGLRSPDFPASGKPFQPRGGQWPVPKNCHPGFRGAAGGPDPAAVAGFRGLGWGWGAAGRPHQCASPSFVPRLEADPLLYTQVLICTGCTSPRYSSPTNN